MDHFGANRHLQEKALILTHRYTATKIVSADDEVILCRAHGENPTGIMYISGWKTLMWWI